jgi:hypothetical protein
MPDPQGFEREYLLNWTSSDGDWFYTVFAREPRKFVKPEIPLLRKSPILRGWDFGQRHPAVTWSQIGPDGRFRVLRNLLVPDIDIHSFRDLVLYLSGQDLVPGAPKEVQLMQLERRERAIEALELLKSDPPLWEGLDDKDKELVPELRIPFFPPGCRFMDYAGQEATQHRSYYSSDGERCDAEVLGTAGINLNMLWQPVSYGVRIIRRMLLEHIDGKGPGMLVDARCEDFIDGMAGGLVWPKGTTANPEPDDDAPWKDGYYEHLHDCVRYTVVNVLGSAEELQRIQEAATPVRETPKPTVAEQVGPTVQSNEVMYDRWSPEDEDW